MCFLSWTMLLFSISFPPRTILHWQRSGCHALCAWAVACPTHDSCTCLRSLPTRPLFHSTPFGNVLPSHTKGRLLSPAQAHVCPDLKTVSKKNIFFLQGGINCLHFENPFFVHPDDEVKFLIYLLVFYSRYFGLFKNHRFFASFLGLSVTVLPAQVDPLPLFPLCCPTQHPPPPQPRPPPVAQGPLAPKMLVPPMHTFPMSMYVLRYIFWVYLIKLTCFRRIRVSLFQCLSNP